MISRDIKEALENVSPGNLGFGEFSPMTKFLLNEDYITIEIVNEKYWRAQLTNNGTRALSEYSL